MTFVAILQWITGPYVSVCLGKLNNQVPKHCLIKDKAQRNTAKVCNKTKQWNKNCVMLKLQLGSQGSAVRSSAATPCCGAHSSHYPLTWWSSPFHLCLPSSPIHKVSPGSSSRSLMDEASLKTCSCGCNWRAERKEHLTCLSYLFFTSTYFKSFTQQLNTFKVAKNTVRIQPSKNRPAGLLIFVIFLEEVERRPFPMVFEPKRLAGESCYTLSAHKHDTHLS